MLLHQKKFQVLKMDRKAILAVVKAIMKNIAQKHQKLISSCFFVVVTIILQCFHQNCDISPLASYGLIIHAELFQATENALTTQQRIVIITVQSDTTVPSTFKPTVKHFSHSP